MKTAIKKLVLCSFVCIIFLSCSTEESIDPVIKEVSGKIIKNWRLESAATVSGINVSDDLPGESDFYITFNGGGKLVIIENWSDDDTLVHEGTWELQNKGEEIVLKLVDIPGKSFTGKILILSSVELTIEFDTNFNDDYDENLIYKFKSV